MFAVISRSGNGWFLHPSDSKEEAIEDAKRTWNGMDRFAKGRHTVMAVDVDEDEYNATGDVETIFWSSEDE